MSPQDTPPPDDLDPYVGAIGSTSPQAIQVGQQDRERRRRFNVASDTALDYFSEPTRFQQSPHTGTGDLGIQNYAKEAGDQYEDLIRRRAPEFADQVPQARQKFEAQLFAAQQKAKLDYWRDQYANADETTMGTIRRLAIPGAARVTRIQFEKNAKAADAAIQSGTANEDAYRELAAYARLAQLSEDHPFKEAIYSLPSIVGEYAVGGKALGALGKVTPGLGWLAPEAAAPASLLGKGAVALGRGIGLTATVPGAAIEAAASKGSLTDLKNLGPALAHETLQNAVFGSLSEMANLPGGTFTNRLQRIAAKTGAGIAEQQAIDVIGKAAGLQTRYGLMQDILEGKSGDALKNLGVQALTFSALSALHSGDPEAVQKRQMEVLQEHLKKMAGRGVPANEAGANLTPAIELLVDGFNRHPDATPEQLKEMAKQGLGPGPVRDFAVALANEMPEKPAAPEKPTGGPPAPEPGTGLINPVQTGVPGIVSGAREIPPEAPKEAPEATPGPPVAHEQPFDEHHPLWAKETPEQKTYRLLTTSKKFPDVGNTAKFREGGNAPFEAVSDVDGMGKLSKEEGDRVLRAKIDSLREAGLEPYHAGQDEFLTKADTREELQAKLEDARSRLKAKTGTDFSYGIAEGGKPADADAALREAKEAKKAEAPEQAKPTIAELSRRLEAGQAVDPDEALAAAGLDAREQHVLQERFAGRTHEDIANDPELLKKDGTPLQRERIRQIERAALRKFGIGRSLEEQGAPASEQLANALERIEDGKQVKASELGTTADEASPVLYQKADAHLDAADAIDELTTQMLKEAEDNGGRLSAERQRYYADEATRLHERAETGARSQGPEAEELRGQPAGRAGPAPVRPARRGAVSERPAPAEASPPGAAAPAEPGQAAGPAVELPHQATPAEAAAAPGRPAGGDQLAAARAAKTKTVASVIKNWGGLSEKGAAALGIDVKAAKESMPTIFQDKDGKKGKLDLEDLLHEAEKEGWIRDANSPHAGEELLKYVLNGAKVMDAGMDAADRRDELRYLQEKENALRQAQASGHPAAGSAEALQSGQAEGEQQGTDRSRTEEAADVHAEFAAPEAPTIGGAAPAAGAAEPGTEFPFGANEPGAGEPGRERPTVLKFADKLEADARAALQAKLGGRLFTGFDPTIIPDVAKFVAAKIIKGGYTLAQLTRDAIGRFGETVRPHLQAIWAKATELASLGRDDGQTPTATKNAAAALERQKAGLPPLQTPDALRLASPEVRAEALRRIDEEPAAVDQAVAKARSGGVLDPVENALVLYRQNEARLRYRDALVTLADNRRAGTSTPADVVMEAQAKDALDDITKVAKRAGTAAGQALRFRQMAVNEDFSLAQMALRLEAAQGRPLSDQQKLDLVDSHARIEKAQGQSQAAEEAFEAAGHTKGSEAAASPEFRDLLNKRAAAESEQGSFEKQVASARAANQGWGRWAADTLTKLRVNLLISSPVTLAKLVAASAQRVLITPLEELAGAAWSQLPGLSKIAAAAPRQGGGLNPTAERQSFAAAFGQGLKDAWQTLRTGQSELDLLHGNKSGEPSGWLDYQFRLHDALKAPAVRAEYTRSFLKRLDAAAQAGQDVTSPAALLRMGSEAYQDAQAAKFRQDNWLVDRYNRFVSGLRQEGQPVASQAAGFVLKQLTPIVRIPTNLAFEVGTHIFGVGTGAIQATRAFARGLENLAPAEADSIMRQFKKGSLGFGLLLAGYFNPQMFGGYYSGKRDDKDVPAGAARLGGVTVPSWLMHNPALETLQFGASVRRAADKMSQGEKQGLGEGSAEALLGLGREMPLLRETAEVGKGLSPNASERGAFFGELTKSLVVPQFAQWLAGRMDTNAAGEPIQRKPAGVLQHVETGIPGLRQRVPTAEERKKLQAQQRRLQPARIKK